MRSKQIKHYVTAFSNDVVKLDREVNELLAKGYQPYGDPYISDHELTAGNDHFLACQAMVRYEDDESTGMSSAAV